MTQFQREDKYLILKWDDIDKYLSRQARLSLLTSCSEIGRCRRADGKRRNTYVVVNEDEPYASQVWDLIQKHWEGNQPHP